MDAAELMRQQRILEWVHLAERNVPEFEYFNVLWEIKATPEMRAKVAAGDTFDFYLEWCEFFETLEETKGE